MHFNLISNLLKSEVAYFLEMHYLNKKKDIQSKRIMKKMFISNFKIVIF